VAYGSENGYGLCLVVIGPGQGEKACEPAQLYQPHSVSFGYQTRNKKEGASSERNMSIEKIRRYLPVRDSKIHD
jgi:hypothetical protein